LRFLNSSPKAVQLDPILNSVTFDEVLPTTPYPLHLPGLGRWLAKGYHHNPVSLYFDEFLVVKLGPAKLYGTLVLINNDFSLLILIFF
jgi:hypothetical protein